jgi:hypothetical protein
MYDRVVWDIVRVGILLTCGKHLHGRIKSLWGEAWAHKTSLVPPHFIQMPVSSQDSERSCICVLVVPMMPLSTIILIDFGIVPTVWYFMFFILFLHRKPLSSNKWDSYGNQNGTLLCQYFHGGPRRTITPLVT